MVAPRYCHSCGTEIPVDNAYPVYRLHVWQPRRAGERYSTQAYWFCNPHHLANFVKAEALDYA